MVDDDICMYVAKEAFLRLKNQEPRGSVCFKGYYLLLGIAIWDFEPASRVILYDPVFFRPID